MIFAHPFLLLLLMVPLALAFWEWNRTSHPIVLPFDHSRPRKGVWLRRLVNGANLLPSILLAVAIILVAGPQRHGPPERERVMTNIQFLLDVSGSMMGEPYDNAMKAINEFIAYRTGDAFGLTIFGNEVLHWVPLTKDTSAIKLATPFLRPERQAPWMGGTQIGKALRSCRKLLAQREEGDRMIILVSDGDSSDMGGSEPNDVAQELREDRIVLYMVAIPGSPPDAMYTIAETTGGQVFAADDPSALSTIFKHIDHMQRTKLKQTAPVTLDWFPPFALAGCAAAGLHLIALCGVRYTPW